MSDIGQPDPYVLLDEAQAYAKACEKTAALNQRENVSLKTEIAKLQAKLDKEIAQHAETKRQLTELDARYTPLVTEDDELRERIERAIAVLNDTKLCAGELADLTLEALRGS